MNIIVPTRMHPFIEGAHTAIMRLQALGSPVHEPLREEKRTGGFLCVGDSQGRPIWVCAIGAPPEDKWDRCLAFCQEKVRRLGGHPDHLRSMQSRDPKADQYGGALRGEKYIVAFSGFPEELDEVIAGISLCKEGDLRITDVPRMLDDNSYVVSYGADWVTSLLV